MKMLNAEFSFGGGCRERLKECQWTWNALTKSIGHVSKTQIKRKHDRFKRLEDDRVSLSRVIFSRADSTNDSHRMLEIYGMMEEVSN